MVISSRFVLAAATVFVVATTPSCAAVRRGSPPPAGAVEPAGAPATFLRLARESETARTIAVREGLGRAGAWRALSEYLAQRHTISVRDQAAGFAMTAWEASLLRDGVPDLRYRTRLVITYLGDDWRQLHVRAEANWKEGDEWQVGVDRVLLERTAADLQARVGRPQTQGR